MSDWDGSVVQNRLYRVLNIGTAFNVLFQDQVTKETQWTILSIDSKVDINKLYKFDKNVIDWCLYPVPICATARDIFMLRKHNNE